jgi:hypothetical protein
LFRLQFEDSSSRTFKRKLSNESLVHTWTSGFEDYDHDHDDATAAAVAVVAVAAVIKAEYSASQ